MGIGSDRGLSSGRGVFAGSRLKVVLIAGDGAAIGIGYAVSLALTAGGRGLVDLVVVTATAVLVGLWAVHWQGLHLARVSALRAMELSRTIRAVAVLTAAMMLTDRVAHLGIRLRDVIPASTATLILLWMWRSMYRSTIANARTSGRHQRHVIVIGTNDESARMVELCATHPEVGFDVIGVIGDFDQANQHGLTNHWLGTIDNTEQLATRLAATTNLSGVFITPGAIPTEQINTLIRNLHQLDLHIHLTTGIGGLDTRRLRLLPVAHEPFLYLEPPTMTRPRIIAKRCFDITTATLTLIILSPLLAAIATAIKLCDHGPILFIQQLVGRNGEHFGVYKFRTMCTNAEAQLAQLATTNERNGPLFKIGNDPRVTRIGRFLRETSLDEIPQLLNVLRGQMSLVGPRPALPTEVANFTPQHRTRETVLPGITGLWQTEARDNPSFTAYQRLDLFYVENWSTTLDLMIILATIEQLAHRTIRIIHHTITHHTPTTNPTPTLNHTPTSTTNPIAA